MAIASSSGRRVGYIAEVTPGTTPATPTFLPLRITGGAGLRATKVTAPSDEVRPDRNVTDAFLLGVDASGSFDFELTYGTFDDMLSSVLSGNWVTNTLKNGIARNYFTFEETLELGATDAFFRYPMSRVNTFSIDITARQKITGSVGLMAASETRASTAIAGATYTAANTNEVMTGSNSVGTLGIMGIAPDPLLRRISLEINQGLRVRPTVGDINSQEFGEGRVEITGTLEAFFESMDLYDEVANHTAGNLNFTIGHEANKKYTFSMPNTRFMDGTVVRGGNNDDVMVNISFQALYQGGATLSSIVVTRLVA